MPTKLDKKRSAALDAYYRTLAEFEQQYALHEGAVSVAFQTLLSESARPHHWTLIPQLSDKSSGGSIRPDGTLKDQMSMVRGHWEAKDTSDDLDAEISRKIKRGYPLGNIIFEDTRTASLFQNKVEVMRVDLTDREQLSRLLDQFFAYVEPQIENFEKAIDEFKERVPDLAKALKDKVLTAHEQNKPFKAAFARFFELCQTSLNPNIAKDAVDDMLVQHLLTERLIREIFDNPEFTRRNVIAAEIEKVIDALTSKSFNRDTFLRSLDRFYIAIENAARTITDWSDKQHFLNTVYERFFQGYSVKLADTMGIVYTPQEIVDFMCASVAEVLEEEFGKKLWSDDVYIIDPCTGTGNFIVNLIRRIPKAKLEDVYKHRLFANEIMLLPYYIAALNIEHAYFEQTGEYEGFEGLCFVDTLDLAEHAQGELGFMSARNSERVERQRSAPITVVIGNPPYNMGQADENDNNKNRKYPVVDLRIRATYAADSKATLLTKLYDAYAKFFRWATDRLEGRDGIVCFVSNNSFVEQRAFDSMRQHLLKDFDLFWHVDLHGDVRKNPKLSGTTHNVFGIQVGVGVTVAARVRSGAKKVDRGLRYHRVPENWRREQKLSWLSGATRISGVEWTRPEGETGGHWLETEHGDEFDRLLPITSKEARSQESAKAHVLFQLSCPGVNTARDAVVYDFDADALTYRITEVCENFNSEVDRYRRKGRPEDIDGFVDYDLLKWSAGLKSQLAREGEAVFTRQSVQQALYRPFNRRFLYYDRILLDRPSLFDRIFPLQSGAKDNCLISLSGLANTKPFHALVAREPADFHCTGDSQCFPFYVYDEDGSNRRENITDWALKQFRDHYKDKKIDKWAIFHYVYGLLHHAGYREKFADNLKRELPRIPFAPANALSKRSESKGETSGFWAFAIAGKGLATLHLDYEKLKPWELEFQETPGEPLSYRVEDKMRLSKDKTALTVNKSLALAGIPPEVFEYRLGNRSALEWVIDQYQVSTDKRSGIVSDPNREDDPEYIVRLVGQVVRVSVETVGMVKGLPAEFAAP